MWYFHMFCIFISNMLREDMLDKMCAKKEINIYLYKKKSVWEKN